MKNKFAFTLAEVLITLVIIGVVAALTISAVINTYVERSTISKVKKGLSTLAQTKKLAEAQNGSIVGWDYPAGFSAEASSAFYSYLKPYLSVVKDCGANTACYTDDSHTLDGDLAAYNSNTKYYKFIIADGSVMWMRTETSGSKCSQNVDGLSNVCAVFWYDINGNKQPNVVGKDIFLYLMNVDGVYPDMKADCNKNSAGWGCSGYIIKNDNMDYLH